MRSLYREDINCEKFTVLREKFECFIDRRDERRADREGMGSSSSVKGKTTRTVKDIFFSLVEHNSVL